MSNYYRYTFERGKSHTCPFCGEKKKYVRYVDSETEELLPEKYGKCNRSDKCGYHLNPYKDGFAKTASYSTGASALVNNSVITKEPYREPAFVPNSILQATLGHYEQNIFIQNLLKNVPYPFLPQEVENICSLYRIGTITGGYMKGGVTFPFIDEEMRVRTIQVKLFDSLNHTTNTDSLPSMIARQYTVKAEKEPPWPARSKPMPEWLVKYQQNELKVSCLFGAHLLPNFPLNRIALVEAPKTAIYGALSFGPPSISSDLLWLAVYSRDTLTVEKCRVLNGRTVYLFPDLSRDGSTFKKWKQKAEEIERRIPGLRIVVSDWLEQVAPKKSRFAGEDLADFIVRMDWREFRSQRYNEENCSENTENRKSVESSELFKISDTKIKKVDSNSINKNGSNPSDHWQILDFTPCSWDKELDELADYFEELLKSGKLPNPPIKLDNHPPIYNIAEFIKINLETSIDQSGNPSYLPYFNRLIDLRSYLEKMLSPNN